MNYKKAWKCHKCPQSNNEDGCPCWVEFMAVNRASNNPELQKMCIFQAFPVFFTEMLFNTTKSAAAIESWRNAEIDVLDTLKNVMIEGLADQKRLITGG